MKDFEKGNCLSPFEKRKEGIEKTFKFPEGGQRRNQEKCSKGDDGPQEETDCIVGEEVLL